MLPSGKDSKDLEQTPPIEAKPTAQEAIEDLIQNPDNPDLQAVFRVQLDTPGTR